MVFNATFSNISVISWLSVLLVEEIGVPKENHWPAVSHWQTLSHNVIFNTPHHPGIQTHNFSVEIQLPYDHDHNHDDPSMQLKFACGDIWINMDIYPPCSICGSNIIGET
jgi:hypothetical protein